MATTCKKGLPCFNSCYRAPNADAYLVAVLDHDLPFAQQGVFGQRDHMGEHRSCRGLEVSCLHRDVLRVLRHTHKRVNTAAAPSGQTFRITTDSSGEGSRRQHIALADPGSLRRAGPLPSSDCFAAHQMAPSMCTNAEGQTKKPGHNTPR